MADGDLTFHPLYWIFHDNFKWTDTTPNVMPYPPTVTTYRHPGHVHFWMMGFPVQNNPSQQAYGGKQVYKFELEDIWSPRSSDKNQQRNIRIVGSPKWYFYIEEYWRRVYIQQWEYFDNPLIDGFVGKRGIKYDASKAMHTFGPFREGKDNFFMMTSLARGLPVEYFLDERKEQREHFLNYGDGVKNTFKWNEQTDFPKKIKEPAVGDKWEDCFDGNGEFVIPRGITCGGDSYLGDFRSYSDEDYARRSYPDRMFLNPTLEYQKVIHKNWERLDGWLERDVDEDEMTGETFGDGFALEISIPYTLNAKIQSPFSDDNLVVYPPGTYCHDVVKDEDKLRYRNDKFWNEGEATPTTNHYPKQNEMGQVVQWHVPNSSWRVDGKWVEQCLGAFVQAKAKVIVEDSFGGRSVYWVNDIAMNMDNAFKGVDYGGPQP